MIVSEEINANDKKNKSPKSNKKARNSTKMTKSILDHNDFDTEREDYELKFISLKEKLTKAEQTISELKNNTEDLEFKVFKKRGKIKTLKEELENLKMKMQLYEICHHRDSIPQISEYSISDPIRPRKFI